MPDPTRTLTLRRQFERESNRRWNEVKRLVSQYILVDDALRLKSDNPLSSPTTDTQRIRRFNQWFSSVSFDNLLQSTLPQQVIGADKNWMTSFIEDAYLRGMRQSERDLRAGGFPDVPTSTTQMFKQTRHRNSLNELQERYNDDMAGIIDATTNQSRRAVSDVLLENGTANEMVDRIDDRIDKVGKHRSTMLTLTAPIDAFARGGLNRLLDLGFEQVEIVPELKFTTAGDLRVCIRCRRLSRQDNGFGVGIFPIVLAFGIIPVHVGCRCRWQVVPRPAIASEPTEQPPIDSFAKDLEQRLKLIDEYNITDEDLGVDAVMDMVLK